MKQQRRVPEVLQSSLMDCGPAALKSVLAGFGLKVDYDLLRRRCQTNVDGTSIDALAELGKEFGLRVAQVMVPVEHVLLPSARCLPAIVVTRTGEGLLHFLVVWRKLGPFVEVMNPGSGRSWIRASHLLANMPKFALRVSAARWRRWATRQTAQGPWRARLKQLGVGREKANRLLEQAAQDPTWQSFGRLDSGLRFTKLLVEGKAVTRGAQVFRLLESLCTLDPRLKVPPRLSWVSPSSELPNHLIANGCVVLNFSAKAGSTPDVGAITEGRQLAATVRQGSLESDKPPLRVLWTMLRQDAGPTLWGLGLALVATAVLIPLETLLLRTLLDLNRHLVLGYQQLGWLVSLGLLVALGLWLDLWTGKRVAQMGRTLETRIRAALLERLPRLGDEYLRSRASSDMANRGHSIHVLRTLPRLWTQLARTGLTLLALMFTLLWVYPEGSTVIVTLGVASLLVPFVGRRSLSDRSLRMHTQSAALDRFYLDALLGVVPVRVHGAEQSIQAAYEELLTEWARTAKALHRDNCLVRGLQIVCTLGVATWLIANYLIYAGDVSRLLILAFLTLRLPATAGELTSTSFLLRNLRTLTLRALAPLAAQVPVPLNERPVKANTADEPSTPGVAIALDSVHVVAGGHTLLENITLQVPSSQHWGIVGASGAGKSSLLGLLLGWLEPQSGCLTTDGQPLTPVRQLRLRAETAWVDPAIQIWDQSLLENLSYGDNQHLESRLRTALSTADLLDVLQRLPNGLQSQLGEGGIKVSGGEGQRVRLGRALLREKPRLVLLDEPFRGLESRQRRELLHRCREHWKRSTLLLVSHDVEDTLELDQVIVIQAGRIVEQGCPRALSRDPTSHYARQLTEARALYSTRWKSGTWRRMSVHQGRLRGST